MGACYRDCSASTRGSDNQPWNAVLEGSLRSSAEGFLEDIVEDLGSQEREIPNPALSSQLALLYAYLELARPGGEARNRSIKYLDQTIDQWSASRWPASSLHGGLSGAAWIIGHAAEIMGDSEAADDSIVDIDRLLLGRLRRDCRTELFDLTRGLVGIGVYFLARLPRASAYEALTLIVNHLEERSEDSWGGTTWLTPAAHLSNLDAAAFPSGCYCLGVAQGTPGIAHFLGQLIAANIETPRARRLLNGAIRWLLAKQRPSQALSRYSAFFLAGVEPSDSRLAWCSGDLGIGAVLYDTGRRLGREDWTRHGIALLDHSLRRTRENGRVLDPSLCHGALGVAHIYNRVAQAADSESYRLAAMDWYQQGLDMRKAGAGIGGFLACMPVFNPVADPTFLSGAIGAALTLVSAIWPVEPRWDQLLLLSGLESLKFAEVAPWKIDKK